MKILHIADIHWRGLSRHQEYVAAFEDLFRQARTIKPDVIYVGGDIVHSKTQGISPELVEKLAWWFNEMSKIAPVHVILGNHDGLIHNKDRQDAVTPIIEAINNKKIFLYKDSGVYPTGIPGFDWCVFSCFDEENWKNVKPSENISIALFHGAVAGSLTDIDWSIDGEVPVRFFDAFDFGLLGDIHKRQFLNNKKTVAYSGSTIQQNYGEDLEKGFLVWDIRTRDDFDVEFYPVKNDYQFITVEWKGDVEKTIKACLAYPDLSRFRISAQNDYITPEQTKTLQKSLKNIKNASEVVFKIDNSFAAEKIKESEATVLNLREPKVIKSLMRQYYTGNQEISENEWNELDKLTSNYIASATEENSDLRNVKWSINKLRFDNTFCYGEGNEINLEKLPGITGIFGKNARGKSSIIGTLAYGLFNSSDRGSIKNIHIINSRKNSCKVEIDISVNGAPFRVVRETTKKYTKNDLWAPTNLSVHRLDSSGEIIEDKTEEQRRETEKYLRSMIGTAEEFHMTSLASQGEMNTFIKEKATARKNILSNFLDLSVFDTLNDLAKKETAAIRNDLKRYAPDTGTWSKKLQELIKSRETSQALLDKILEDREALEQEIENLTSEVHKNVKEDFVSELAVEKALKKVATLKDKISQKQTSLDEAKANIAEHEEKIKKIEDFIESFNVSEIKTNLETFKNLEKTLWQIESLLKSESAELLMMEKSVKKLLEVPCGESFPSCMFIKDSHRDKAKIEDKRESVNRLQTNVADLRESYKKLSKENYEDKIDKYNALLQKKSNLISKISNDRVQIQAIQNEIENLNLSYQAADRESQDLKAKFEGQDLDNDVSGIVKLLDSKKKALKTNDTERISKIKQIEGLDIAISTARDSSDRFDKLNTQIKVQDLFIQATSSRGIPVQIINFLLPKINAEIAKILKGVVAFTVILEADLESNAMDVFIDYGDSKRIVELASGMEKMISSLAIRVALINISSLPKSSMLLIDEGFGTLDETNLESCGRLLHSLKKSFKNIIVISHIDEIKDIVDNSIEIMREGVDSYVQVI